LLGFPCPIYGNPDNNVESYCVVFKKLGDIIHEYELDTVCSTHSGEHRSIKIVVGQTEVRIWDAKK
jgi:hypothetical protein